MDIINWKEALRGIAEQLDSAGIRYKVVGGTSVALQGVCVPINDFDLEMKQADAYAFESLFAEFTVKKVMLRESAYYRSYFGVFHIYGALVEVSGDLERLENGRWVPTWCRTTNEINLDHVIVPVSWLEEEVLAYIRRGRLERAAACLEKCETQKLLQLIRREVEPGVI